MINRDVEIVDLYPLTWRNLGAILSLDEFANTRPRAAHGLSILHQNGKVLRIAASAGVQAQAQIQIGDHIGDPQQTAQVLYEALKGQVKNVQIFEKSSLREFSNAVQQLDWQHLTSGDFYLHALQLLQADSAGLVYYPPESAPYTNSYLEHARHLIASTPDNGTLVLGIYDEGRPYFTLILQVKDKQITLCTTFEYLEPYGIDPVVVPSSAADSERVIAAVNEHVGPVAHSMFCERRAFEQWRDRLRQTSPVML